MLFNVVNSLEQCGQQNVVQYCFHQLRASCSFWLIFYCVSETIVSKYIHANSLVSVSFVPAIIENCWVKTIDYISKEV